MKVVSAAGIAPAVAPSRTEHVAATPRAVCPGAIRKGAGGLFSLEANRSVPGRRLAGRFQKLALPAGLAPALFPQTTGCFSIQLRERLDFQSPIGNCQLEMKLVGGAGNAPVVASDFVLRHRFYRPATGTPPGWRRGDCYSPTCSLSHLPTCSKGNSGGGSCTHLTEFMRLRSVLWSSSPQCKRGLRNAESGQSCIARRDVVPRFEFRVPRSKVWSRRVTLPHEPACRAGALLVCHDPM